MARSSLVAVAAVLFLFSCPELPAQISEPTRTEKVEFSEAELPTYDQEALSQLIRYPKLARDNAIEGRVVVKFLLDTNGKATRLEIVESANPLLSDAAIEALRNLTFTPAYQKGKPVRVWMSIPITFTLSPD